MTKTLKNNPVITSTELKLDEKNRTLEHYISSERVNEYGYKLRTKGMDDTDYRNNSQVFYLHFSGSSFFGAPAKPSDTIIGTNLKLTKHNDGFISAVTKFAETDLGEEVMQFNKAGLLNAWSLRWGWNDPNNYEQDIEEKDGLLTVTKWKLKEYSSVPLPANPDATNKLALEQMLSESNVPIMQQSLSSALIYENYREELESLKLDFDNKLKALGEAKTGEVAKKDLTDLRAEVKSQIGDLRKNLMDKILGISLNNFNFKTNFDKNSLMKMEQIADDRILRYVGKKLN